MILTLLVIAIKEPVLSIPPKEPAPVCIEYCQEWVDKGECIENKKAIKSTVWWIS